MTRDRSIFMEGPRKTLAQVRDLVRAAANTYDDRPGLKRTIETARRGAQNIHQMVGSNADDVVRMVRITVPQAEAIVKLGRRALYDEREPHGVPDPLEDAARMIEDLADDVRWAGGKA